MLIADVRLEDVKSGESDANRPFREDPVVVPGADAGSYVSAGERPFLVGVVLTFNFATGCMPQKALALR